MKKIISTFISVLLILLMLPINNINASASPRVAICDGDNMVVYSQPDLDIPYEGNAIEGISFDYDDSSSTMIMKISGSVTLDFSQGDEDSCSCISTNSNLVIIPDGPNSSLTINISYECNPEYYSSDTRLECYGIRTLFNLTIGNTSDRFELNIYDAYNEINTERPTFTNGICCDRNGNFLSSGELKIINTDYNAELSCSAIYSFNDLTIDNSTINLSFDSLYEGHNYYSSYIYFQMLRLQSATMNINKSTLYSDIKNNDVEFSAFVDNYAGYSYITNSNITAYGYDSGFKSTTSDLTIENSNIICSYTAVGFGSIGNDEMRGYDMVPVYRLKYTDPAKSIILFNEGGTTPVEDIGSMPIVFCFSQPTLNMLNTNDVDSSKGIKIWGSTSSDGSNPEEYNFSNNYSYKWLKVGTLEDNSFDFVIYDDNNALKYKEGNKISGNDIDGLLVDFENNQYHLTVNKDVIINTDEEKFPSDIVYGSIISSKDLLIDGNGSLTINIEDFAYDGYNGGIILYDDYKQNDLCVKDIDLNINSYAQGPVCSIAAKGISLDKVTLNADINYCFASFFDLNLISSNVYVNVIPSEVDALRVFDYAGYDTNHESKNTIKDSILDVDFSQVVEYAKQQDLTIDEDYYDIVFLFMLFSPENQNHSVLIDNSKISSDVGVIYTTGDFTIKNNSEINLSNNYNFGEVDGGDMGANFVLVSSNFSIENSNFNLEAYSHNFCTFNYTIPTSVSIIEDNEHGGVIKTIGAISDVLTPSLFYFQNDPEHLSKVTFKSGSNNNVYLNEGSDKIVYNGQDLENFTYLEITKTEVKPKPGPTPGPNPGYIIPSTGIK